MNASPSSRPRPSAPNRALEACLDRIGGLGLDPRSDNVLLAVSGGADRMAMAHAFAAWRRRAPGPAVRALVVDHGLRPESGGEAAKVRGWLRDAGIDASVAAVGEAPPRGGIQAWARERRYRLLAREAAPRDAAVVTAHHRGDQAETVLMRSRRRSGLAGLAGMARKSTMAGVRLYRPFLDLDRGTLAAALDGAGIPTVDDPSNRDPRFERVRVRRELAESGEGAQWCRLADAAARLSAALLEGVDAAMAGRAEISPMGYGRIGHAAFAALPGVAREALLARMLRAMSTSPRPPAPAGLARLAESLLRGRAATFGGCEWRPSGADGEREVVCLAEAGRTPPATVPDGGFCLHDRRWQVFLPGGFRGRVEAIGPARFAALRRLHPGWTVPRGVPARAFWRIPALVAGPGRCRDSLGENALALDGSTFVAHLVGYGKDGEPAAGPLPCMRFIGGRR